MAATLLSGGLMWAVHLLARFISPGEYGLFGAYFALAMSLPALPVQMAMAQQTTQALVTGQLSALAGRIHFLMRATFALWLLLASVLLAFRHTWQVQWSISNPGGLYVTVAVLLLTLWMPVFSGILQGAQRFVAMGAATLLNGGGRLCGAAIAVIAFGAQAAGMMTGVLIGLALALSFSMWTCRALWARPAPACDWRALVRQVLPPALGFGAFLVMMSVDMLYARMRFSAEDSGYFASTGTLSRALLWALLPISIVLFSRVGYSTASGRSEHSLLPALLLTGTLLTAAAFALGRFGTSLAGWVWGEQYLTPVTSLLPWYAAAMVPLGMANVLLTFLLAKADAGVVRPLWGVVALYITAVLLLQPSMISLLQLLSLFAWVFFGLCLRRMNRVRDT